MNTVVTSKEQILQTSRELIRQQGWSTVSIRSVAAACGVSVGSIYNYFDSKAELWAPQWKASGVRSSISLITKLCSGIPKPVSPGCMSAWSTAAGSIRDFSPCIPWDSCGRKNPDGKRRMQQTWQHILDGLCLVLKRDTRVRPDAFTDQFTEEKFADVLFSLMLSALLRQDYDPTAVLEIVRRTLY